MDVYVLVSILITCSVISALVSIFCYQRGIHLRTIAQERHFEYVTKPIDEFLELYKTTYADQPFKPELFFEYVRETYGEDFLQQYKPDFTEFARFAKEEVLDTID